MENEADRLFETHAFVDGELDVTRQLAMERAMAGDPALRARVERVRDERAAIRGGATYHAMPASLAARIEGLAPPIPAKGGASRGGRAAYGRGLRWTSWRPLATAVAATVVLSTGAQVWLAERGRDARLVDEVVASHVRATLGDRAVDVASSDHHTVKPWLSARLDFSPPVRDTGVGEAAFLGGRVDYLDGRRVAALVYRQGAHLTDVYVWPDARGDRGIAFSDARGYRIASWTRRGMRHCVVSDVSRPELVDLVERLSQPLDDAATP